VFDTIFYSKLLLLVFNAIFNNISAILYSFVDGVLHPPSPLGLFPLGLSPLELFQVIFLLFKSFFEVLPTFSLLL
jgi:hypothetical protein